MHPEERQRSLTMVIPKWNREHSTKSLPIGGKLALNVCLPGATNLSQPAPLEIQLGDLGTVLGVSTLTPKAFGTQACGVLLLQSNFPKILVRNEKANMGTIEAMTYRISLLLWINGVCVFLHLPFSKQTNKNCIRLF